MCRAERHENAEHRSVGGLPLASAELRFRQRTAVGTHPRRMTVPVPLVGIGPTGIHGFGGGFAGLSLISAEPPSDGRRIDGRGIGSQGLVLVKTSRGRLMGVGLP